MAIMVAERNWIVVSGQLIDNTEGGGFEFFGPYTEDEAKAIKQRLAPNAQLTMSIELLRISNDRIDD